MNSDNPLPPPSDSSGPPPLDLALEARIVACVLGDASAFETAEIDRLCAEQPAAEAFRRHIAETHGVVAEAFGPAPTDLRLSAERRAKLLATLSGAVAVSDFGNHDAKLSSAVSFVRPRPRRWTDWALPAAACLALLGLIAAIVIPTVGTTFGVASGERGRVEPMDLVFKSAPQMEAVESTVTRGNRFEVASPAAPSAVAPSLVEVSFRLDAPSTPSPVSAAPEAPQPAGAITDARRLEGLANETRRRQSVRAAATAKEKADFVYRDLTDAHSDAYSGSFAGNGAAADEIQTGAEIAKNIATVSFKPAPAVTQSGWTVPSSAVSAPSEEPASREKDVSFSELQLRGSTQYAAGDLDAAEETLRKAEAQKPDSAATRYFLNRIADDKRRVTAQTLSNEDSAKVEKAALAWQRPGVVGEKKSKQEADAPKPAPRPAPDASLRLETPSADEPVSTFSLHVSDASFRLARAALARGEFPDPAAVRPEEFYNAFDYGDPAPRAGEPVAARVEQAAHPFLQQRNLLRVALRVPAAGRAAGQPLRLTLLLDTSGSMEREDRAAIVRRALEQLAALLGPNDRVSLVGFARTPRLLADRLPGDQAAALARIAAETPPEGGTNLEAALELAAELALRQFDAAAQNRVVLLTDGAANLGAADPAVLSARVVSLREKGLAFDACGVGANGLDDGVLEALTRQGDGRYLLLDSADEAGPDFAKQLAGAFRPAAQNVKVQVRFNAARVPRYRLIGFEQHRLREQDFRDDKVDAAELAAAEAAVALYQIEVDPQGSGELGEVFVRFRETATGQMVERSWPLPYEASAPAFDRASPSLQLAGASALLAEKLRGGDLAAQIRLADLDPVAAVLRGRCAGQPSVAEFLDMLAQARRLAPE